MAGGAGLAGILSMGETAPPWEYGQIASNAGTEETQGQELFGAGQGYLGQGAQALAMGQAGQLTPQQTAQLQLYRGKVCRTKRRRLCQHGPQHWSRYVWDQCSGRY